VVTLLVVGIWPTVFALITSFRHYNLTRARDGFAFVGVENYINVLSDAAFWNPLGTTARFFCLVMPVELVLGVGIALLLNKPGWTPIRALARICLVIPLATTYAVVGLLGRLMFNRDFGLVNGLLIAVGIGPVDWLDAPVGAFVAVAAMDVWQWTPFCALIFLSGLTTVPVEVEEAARLETRRPFALLWHVQLPFLLPGLTAMLILRSTDVLKLFDTVFTMTRGGPGTATEVMSILIQRIGFRVFDLGTASAQAILLLLLTIILSRLYIRFLYKETP
jgi:multiple sugar transport system permease protein